MKIIDRSVAIFALLSMLVGMPSCVPVGPPQGTYRIDTFEFVPSSPNQDVGDPIPKIWIDTHTKLSSLSGGELTSSLPCAVMIDYTDNSLKIRSAEFTAVTITYDDGTADPAAKAIKLPLRIAAREYESVNSVSGGKIVKVKDWIISGSVPNVITRAEPFRLQMEGYFTNVNGRQLPFKIDQHFDIDKESAIKSAAEVLQDK